MKRVLGLMLVLLLTAGLFTGCGGGQKPADNTTAATTSAATQATTTAAAKKVKVGFATCNMNDTFQTYVADAAKAKAVELGYEIKILDAQEDVVKQQDQVNALIQEGVTAIIVVPVDTSAMAPITAAVTKAGIPLVYVNRNPFGTASVPKGVYYVGSQEIVAGQLQGDYLIKKMGEKGGVAILEGLLTNEGAVKRTEGNETVLKKYPGIKILAKEAGDWQTDKAMSITENWLTAYGKDLNAILANNDGMAIGALKALEQAGRKDVIVMGVDAIPDALNLVSQGKLAATVLQDAKGQGAGGITVISQILGGKTPEAITWIPFQLVTPDNVKNFQK